MLNMENYQEQEGYISLHIFYQLDLNDLLLDTIQPLIFEWYQAHRISRHFFLRLWEGSQHIRLRLVTGTNESADQFAKDIFLKNGAHAENSSAFDPQLAIAIEPYVQELARYGGQESMALAENVFYNASLTAVRVLQQYRSTWSNSTAISVALQANLLFVKASGSSLADAIQLMSFLSENYIAYSIRESQDFQIQVERNQALFNASYHQQKISIDYLCKTIWEQDMSADCDWRSEWFDAMISSLGEFKNLESKHLLDDPHWLEEINRNNVPEGCLKRWSVWGSYLHMTNNALGILLRDESFLYDLARNGLSAMIHKETLNKN
jgi:thiopeptide-type bacteriocin biosynthesis protein